MVDIVVTWVDGNDELWRRERSKYKREKGDKINSRYRDWGFLKYWFRSIEKNAPWVNRIFFVTYGHYPQWLNLDNEKLVLVKHSDFIPEEYLPTFSCRPIEFNLHRISGLSEKFVYFNDDMFLLKPTTESDFFINDLPCDSAFLDAITVDGSDPNGNKLKSENIYASLVFNTAIINRNFNKKEVIGKDFFKWFSIKYGAQNIRNLLLLPWNKFTGIKNHHLPYSYLKATYKTVWEREFDALHESCKHKFRINTDVSSRLLSYWQIAEGKFCPRNPNVGLQFYISDDEKNNRRVCDVIKNKKYKMICLNDEFSNGDFEKEKNKIIKAFKEVFPNPSSYERLIL